MLAQYFLISKTTIDLNELYAKKGKYNYKNGFNVNAIITMIIAGFLCLGGNFIPLLKPLYDMSWFVGIISAFIIYTVIEWQHSKGTLFAKAPKLNEENR
ncbi:cytosine permease [Neobacillus sp. YIM B06451]|uniref:cytosine permease n=1 Tax=Neobacillus sp. YIM B06451 TaxID=3070994 RepID=UPI00292CAE6B|nr:cytosine permease [Neobacillus sp. YIM B06451]